MRKPNSNYIPHLVVSVTECEKGIDVNEDVMGTIQELSALLASYLCIFCNEKGKAAGINPRDVLMSIALPALHNMDKVGKDLEG